MSHHPTCLVVDDEAETRHLLAQIFPMRGYSVRTAEDGFAALRMMRAEVPNLLLSDLHMPGMSGFELLSVVRRLFPQVHVIASSGAYSGPHVPKGIAADAFHEKGTGMASLFALLEISAHVTTDSIVSYRKPVTLWVDLEHDSPRETDHVLINCPACLRPFRQNIDVVNPSIREARCRYCDGTVSYAIALGTKPHAARPALAEETPTVRRA